MDAYSGLFAVRALNHWRTTYIPAYIALRLFLQQLPKSKRSNYLEAFLLQKLPTGELCKYRRFFRFKGFGSARRMEYRSFYAASPSSALAEAYILGLLSKVNGLANRPCVFSYRWPISKKEGRSYRYFFSGYDARQCQVSSLLRTHPNYIVLVHDIRSFYPSIPVDVVYKRLKNHLSKEHLIKTHEITSMMCQKMLQTADGGVPVGPALGHTFGNIALEPVDSLMYGKYKERYLRYVDDIFVVVEPSEINQAQALLAKLITEEGFSLHEEEGKRDEISARDWEDNMRTKAEQDLGEHFDDMLRRVRLFLWRKPDKLVSLQKEFRERGVPMPLQRLAQDAHYGRFQRFMRRYIHTWWGDLRGLAFQFWLDDERKLLARVAQLKEGFLESAKQIDVMNYRHHGMIRRLRVQRLRYLLNRLLYLMPIHEYQSLLDLTPDVDEFFEYRSLLQAVLERRLDPILQLPGPAVATFGSLYKELGFEEYPKYDEHLLNSEGVLDSLCTLALFGKISVPSSWLLGLLQADSEFVRFSLFSAPHSRTTGDHSFEDEIRTLQLGESEEEMRNIINTKFNDLESINLEALLFSEYGY